MNQFIKLHIIVFKNQIKKTSSVFKNKQDGEGMIILNLLQKDSVHISTVNIK